MAQIGTAECTAAVAAAFSVERAVFTDMNGVSQVETALRGVSAGVSRLPGRQNAVEHIDAGGDGVDDAGGIAESHKIAGPVRRKQLRREPHGLQRRRALLPDAETADGVAAEVQFHGAQSASCRRVADSGVKKCGEPS